MDIPGSDEPVHIDELDYATILLGGGQLTVARARGSQLIRSSSGTNKDSLGGLLPVVEDWHTKLCLMQVLFIGFSFSYITFTNFSCRLFGNGYTTQAQECKGVHCIN